MFKFLYEHVKKKSVESFIKKKGVTDISVIKYFS